MSSPPERLGPLLSEKLDHINRRPAAAAMNEHAFCEHKRESGCGRSQEYSVGHGLNPRLQVCLLGLQSGPQLRMPFTTSPCTSVSRKSRPW